MKIEGNPNLTYQQVRRKMARWVNAVRTSDAIPQFDGGGILSDLVIISPHAHRFGGEIIRYCGVGNEKGLYRFAFYNAVCGMLIVFDVGHHNMWRSAGDASKDIKMVGVSLYAACPVPREKRGDKLLVKVGSQLCFLRYLFGPEHAERYLSVNGLRIYSFDHFRGLTSGHSVIIFLDFVQRVIEGGMPFQEYLPTRPPQKNAWTHWGLVRKCGWGDYEQVAHY